MTAFTIHAEKDGQTVTTVRLGPTITVAKARSLSKEGWQVHIVGEERRQLGPDEWDQLLSFDNIKASESG